MDLFDQYEDVDMLARRDALASKWEGRASEELSRAELIEKLEDNETEAASLRRRILQLSGDEAAFDAELAFEAHFSNAEGPQTFYGLKQIPTF